MTFDATLNPVVYEGGVPVFIDTETGKKIFKRAELTHTRSVCVGIAETGGKILSNDFWYFLSRKSTIKENFLLSFSYPKSNIKSPFSYFGISYIDIYNTDM